jgi:hypothetical protein
MNPKHPHSPPPRDPSKVRCPVCNQVVYSRAGIHPQCAIRQAEPPRPKAKPSGPAGLAVPVAGTPEHDGVGLIAAPPKS